MTSYSGSSSRPTTQPAGRRPRNIALILVIIPILYLVTLARTLVLGDPTEFTFVANTLGIAHPPGYAFITLMGKLFQTLIPVGTIPWRMHLLSATAATLAALFVYGMVRRVSQASGHGEARVQGQIAALFAALSVATAADHWQHAIHANPHIITATFLAANLFFLTMWWADSLQPERRQKWLYIFCLSAGLGVSHHPLTVFGFPAYTLFIIWVRPSLLRDWRTLLKMGGLALLGLAVWLYFPIRSPMQPVFGPSTMNTINGFLDHVLARGLTESLPYYSLAEQPNRALVFWTLLRLQFSLPVIFLSLYGLGWLFQKPRRQLFLLYFLAFLGIYAFVISLKAQDIMAYILGPFLVVGLFAGFGALGLFGLIRRRLPQPNLAFLSLAALLLLIGPLLQIGRNLPLISLRDYDEGDAYVEAVFDTFAGQGDGVVLLNDWEHMTPLWYNRYVAGIWPDEQDVRLEFVSAARTWLDNVFDFLSGGPVYLSNYRRDVVDAGFRLRPVGPFFQVVEPGDVTLPAELTPLQAKFGEIELVGYLLPQTAVTAGDYVPLILALRAPQATADFYVPVLHVGQVSYPFTTDSHLVTPDWLPGEVIVERFDFALPHDTLPGELPLTLNLRNLSQDQETELNLPLGQLSVATAERTVETGDLLANFRQRVGLVSAKARGNGRRAAPWTEPLPARPGDLINLTLQWRSLAPAEQSYTVFVHLIDLGNRPIVDNLDYTPLGGASPTHLWIPKWLPGQQMLDPYRLRIPADLAAGTYRIEVGLYEMVGNRRLQISDHAGNLVGDRYILGDVIVGN